MRAYFRHFSPDLSIDSRRACRPGTGMKKIGDKAIPVPFTLDNHGPSLVFISTRNAPYQKHDPRPLDSTAAFNNGFIPTIRPLWGFVIGYFGHCQRHDLPR